MVSPFSYPMHPKEAEALEKQKAELSRTWKERHAKGVPVKMSLLDWRECVKANRKIRNHRPGHSYEHSTVTVHVSDWADETGPEAVFCNFRYKQSWLEKKGGNDGH